MLKMDKATEAQSARMAKLAEQPNTEVLEYVYDPQEREATPEVCVNLAKRAQEARKALTGTHTVEAAMKTVRSQDAVLDQFSRTHPQIFKSMMDLENCGRAMEMLERLARVRQQIHQGNMSEPEGQVHANRIIMERTMRAPTDQEKSTLKLD